MYLNRQLIKSGGRVTTRTLVSLNVELNSKTESLRATDLCTMDGCHYMFKCYVYKYFIENCYIWHYNESTAY